MLNEEIRRRIWLVPAVIEELVQMVCVRDKCLWCPGVFPSYCFENSSPCFVGEKAQHTSVVYLTVNAKLVFHPYIPEQLRSVLLLVGQF